MYIVHIVSWIEMLNTFSSAKIQDIYELAINCFNFSLQLSVPFVFEKPFNFLKISFTAVFCQIRNIESMEESTIRRILYYGVNIY